MNTHKCTRRVIFCRVYLLKHAHEWLSRETLEYCSANYRAICVFSTLNVNVIERRRLHSCGAVHQTLSRRRLWIESSDTRRSKLSSSFLFKSSSISFRISSVIFLALCLLGKSSTVPFRRIYEEGCIAPARLSDSLLVIIFDEFPIVNIHENTRLSPLPVSHNLT